MSGIAFKIMAKPTFRDLKGRFTKANKELLNYRRDEVRTLGQQFVKFAQQEAPKDTGKFSKGIRFRSFQSGNSVGFSVTTPQPLGSFIIQGTKAHVIRPRRARVLRFVVNGRTVFAQSVNHPGTKPNKFIDRAHARWEPSAKSALKRIATRWQQTVING